MSLFRTLEFITNHPLNRSRRTHAILGFVKWQLASRMIPGSVLFDWIAGTRLIVRTGDTGMTQNVYCGLQEFNEMAYVLHLLTPEDLLVDIGANVGSYTVLACGAKGARGICFEPVPATFARLSDNVLINNLSSRVTALNMGISDVDGELPFSVSEGATNHVIARGEMARGAINVPVRRLDSVLTGESPSFLKIDVEGFETPVLDGAGETLSNPSLHSVLIELNGSGTRYGFDEDNILLKLAEHGFSPFDYEPFSRKLSPLQGKNGVRDNTLFVRNASWIQERLSQAPRATVRSIEF